MIASLFSTITDFIASHPHFAYAAVLLLALSESVPIIGAFVPGSAVILAISALVPSGTVMIWPLLFAATVGAIIGDGLSFWLGHRYHLEILSAWPLNRHPELIARSEAFFVRHGDKSIFLARFTPGVRAFVPLLAGMLRMSAWRFYAANVVSALAWAPAHVLPGVLVSTSFGLLGAAAKPIAVLFVILVAGVWGIALALRYALRRGVPRVMAEAEGLRIWAGGRDTRLSRALRSLLDPSRSETRVLAGVSALLIGGAWLFFGILEDVISGDPLVRADAAIYHALQGLRTAPGDTVMIAITEIGDTAVVLPVTLIVFLWLIWKRAWRTSVYWLVAIVGASMLNTVIKATLHRARPDELLYSGWSAFSFPSGHSTVNAVLYGFLAFLIARDVRAAWRLPVALGAAILILLIAFSRLYLGAHWFSDVLGGLAFGTAWLALLGLSYLRRQVERIDAGRLAIIACLALVLAGGANLYRRYTPDFARYAVKTAVPTMLADDWWAKDWQQLPVQRIDLGGEMEEPLTVQWAGSLQDLQEILFHEGWRTAPAWAPSSSLAWLTAQTDPTNLPVVPLLAVGRLPSLTLVRLHSNALPANSRLVLRMWAAGFELANRTPSTLWIGSVVEERLYHPLSLVTLSWAEPNMNEPREVLAAAFDGDGRLVSRAGGQSDKNWDRSVLLARNRGSDALLMAKERHGSRFRIQINGIVRVPAPQLCPPLLFASRARTERQSKNQFNGFGVGH